MSNETEHVSTKGDPSVPGIVGQRIFVIGFLIFFLSSIVYVLVFGFQVVNKAKTNAVETDSALRTVAWAIMVQAATDGEFPTGQGGLVDATSVQTLPGGYTGTEGSPLPTDRNQAMAGAPQMGLDEAMEILVVEWPPDGSLAPVLTTGGRPSGIGTLTGVNTWLVGLARTMSARGSQDGA